MARISGSNTKPEIVVRKILYGLGFRYRLNVRKLPGTPDIVLSKHNKVVFVHGCFWHGHKGCKRSKRPTTNVAFWNKKIDKNIDRDKKKFKRTAAARLEAAGDLGMPDKGARITRKKAHSIFQIGGINGVERQIAGIS